MLAIVGVGLIGGSVALAARRRGVVERIVGVDHDSTALEIARERGILDEAASSIGAAASAADLVVLCTPPDVVANQVLQAARMSRPGTLLTDTASTKSAIVRSLAGQLAEGVAFVGAHPLAGSEKQGPKFADADLFVGRVVVLTPTNDGDEEAVALLQQFWESFGAHVRRMSPEQHDAALALTSHLPHLVASALAGTVPAEVASLTATGFRDTTRIAAGDPSLWRAILESNATDVLDALARFETQLAKFRTALEAGDRAALGALLAAGRNFRTSLDRGNCNTRD
jgi:prephenate dehydrogenase